MGLMCGVMYGILGIYIYMTYLVMLKFEGFNLSCFRAALKNGAMKVNPLILMNVYAIILRINTQTFRRMIESIPLRRFFKRRNDGRQ